MNVPSSEDFIGVMEKLTKAWKIVKWLDDARWSRGASSSLIPGPVFASLDPSSQILTHWLCYITDQQRPWRDVWTLGGPIFAEVVKEYRNTTNLDDVLDLLRAFTVSHKAGSVDTLRSKQQTIQGGTITFTPRFGMHLLSIAGTFYTLVSFGNNIVSYLSDNGLFIFRSSPALEHDSPTVRTVFLLYLLSYADVRKGFTSFHSQKKEISDEVMHRESRLRDLLRNESELEYAYLRWFRNRFYKRLWAGFRDYVKPGSYHEAIFVCALGEIKANSILRLLQEDRKQVLCALELPGDTWNLAFNQKLFDGRINHPSELRAYYNRLGAAGHLSEEFYPEQFDMSFDFAPRMCDRGEENFCPFKGSSKLKEYCLGNAGRGRLCPIVRILCGYESDCLPSECPILAGSVEDICSGCALVVS